MKYQQIAAALRIIAGTVSWTPASKDRAVETLIKHMTSLEDRIAELEKVEPQVTNVVNVAPDGSAPSVDEDESTPSPAELEAAQLRSMLRRVLVSFEMHYSSLYPKLDLANVSPDSLIGEARAMVGRNPRTGEPKYGQD